MIPVATSNRTNGCNPISSNCVVWQGPDIPCIDLCHGDTISEVVYKLASELCDLLDATSLTGLDLSCLDLNQAPQTQKELLQVIIDTLCSLDGRCTTLEGGSGGGGSTSTIMATLPSCLQYTNQQNDLVTQLPIDDYAELVAARVCTILANITAISTTVNNHESRITVLENTVTNNQSSIPQVLPSCVLPAVLTDIDEVVEVLEAEYCNLSNAIGGAEGALSVNSAVCTNLNNSASLSGQGPMSSLVGWNSTVSNLSESLQNLWITVCDIRNAVQSIKDTCCSTSCDDIIFTFVPSLSGNNTTLYLDFTGTSIPAGFVQNNILGSVVSIVDGAGNSFTDYVDIVSAVNAGVSGTVDITTSGLNVVTGLTITTTLAVNNGTIDCNKGVTKTVKSNFECPTLTTTVTETTIDYSFINTNGPVNYSIALMLGSATLATDSISGAGNTVIGQFDSLVAGNTYKITVTVTSGSESKTCTSKTVTTTAAPSCPSPTNVTATVTN